VINGLKLPRTKRKLFSSGSTENLVRGCVDIITVSQRQIFGQERIFPIPASFLRREFDEAAVWAVPTVVVLAVLAALCLVGSC
jgi:hypothetical protein